MYSYDPHRPGDRRGHGQGDPAARRGVAVTATEPDAAMLAELRKQVPSTVRTVHATFEDLRRDGPGERGARGRGRQSSSESDMASVTRRVAKSGSSVMRLMCSASRNAVASRAFISFIFQSPY